MLVIYGYDKGVNTNFIPGVTITFCLRVMLTDSTINEQYLVGSLIAKGGGGEVYQAYDTQSKRQVAFKHLIHSDSYLRSAFLREAKRLEALHHRAFPKVYEWFEVKGDYFIAMEYIPGEDLHEELKERGKPFTLEEVAPWAFILLDALNYLHNFDSENPIIHRDIKPGNLKLNETRNGIFLLDLGLSKGAAGNISEWSVQESIAGYTRCYAAPEQHFKDQAAVSEILNYFKDQVTVREILNYKERLKFFSSRATDARSDLYSLGATLFTLLTNTVPPSAVTRAKQLWYNHRDPLQPIHKYNRQVSPDISDIINRAMSFEPEARFASAIEMRNALRNALNDITHKSHQQQPGANIKYGLLGKCDSAARSVAFSPTGTHLASGSNDGMVRLWNVATGEMIVLGCCDFDKNGLAYVSSVYFSPDGADIASVSNDQAIRLWHTLPKGDDKVRILAIDQNIPRCVALSPCGKYLVSGSSNGAVHLWDVTSGNSTLLGRCVGAVRAIAFAPNGASVMAGSDDENLCIWQIETLSLTTLPTDALDINSIAVSPDGKLVAFGSSDHYVRILATSANSFGDLLVCDGGVRCLAFSPNGLMLAIGGEDRLVRVCDITTGKIIILGQCDDVVSAVVFHSDNRTVASASWDKTIRLWNAEDNN